MLRVTIFDTAGEQRLVLEGKLTEPSLPELESAWEKARRDRQGRRCVIDLSGITLIDQHGKRVLIAMCGEGARFIAPGVATAHMVKEIECTCARRASTTSERRRG